MKYHPLCWWIFICLETEKSPKKSRKSGKKVVENERKRLTKERGGLLRSRNAAQPGFYLITMRKERYKTIK